MTEIPVGEITFVKELPPISRNRSEKWERVAEQLRERPGEWAFIGEHLSSATANFISNGVLAAFRPAGTFEAVCRDQKLSYGKVFARFIGED